MANDRMRVTFEATMDDMVDVHVRSTSTRDFYVQLAIGAISFGGSMALGSYLLSGSWFLVVVAFLAGSGYVLASNYRARERNIRNFLRENYGMKGPVTVEAEISEAGLAFKQFGTTVIHDWSTIRSIEESDDAIYFHTDKKSICAVRKRGFASGPDVYHFLSLAHENIAHQRQLAPSPTEDSSASLESDGKTPLERAFNEER